MARLVASGSNSSAPVCTFNRHTKHSAISCGHKNHFNWLNFHLFLAPSSDCIGKTDRSGCRSKALAWFCCAIKRHLSCYSITSHSVFNFNSAHNACIRNASIGAAPDVGREREREMCVLFN